MTSLVLLENRETLVVCLTDISVIMMLMPCLVLLEKPFRAVMMASHVMSGILMSRMDRRASNMRCGRHLMASFGLLLVMFWLQSFLILADLLYNRLRDP